MNNNSNIRSSVNSELRIYYFTGTGNALQVANWIVDIANKFKIKNEIIDISKLEKEKSIVINPEMMIGFCSPTHGFNFPPIMLKFLWHFPKGRNKVFIINTRAGIKLWKLHLVGLSGIAQLFAAILLMLKGYRVVGMRPVDMPSNWISIHPGLRKRAVSSIFLKCRKSIYRFSDKLFSGKRDYRALFDIIQDIAISPIALGYYFIGRYLLAKSFIASSACTMCRLCIESCPVSAIKEMDKRPFWTFKCESCMKCMNTCPERAIQTAHGMVIGSMYLFFTFGMEWIYFNLMRLIPEGQFSHILSNNWVEFTLASVLFIPLLWIAYRLVHYLMKFKAFEWLVIYTSLTIFKVWRRYKAPRIKSPLVN